MELTTITQTITDPDDWDGSLFGTQLELVKLSSSEFLSTQTVTDVGDGTKLLRLTVNQSVKVRSRPLSARYVGTIFDQDHEGQFAGAAIRSDGLLVFPPDFDFDASIKDGAFACCSIFVPPELLESYSKTLIGEAVEPFDRVRIAEPNPNLVSWIRAWPELVKPANLHSYSQSQRNSIQASLRDNALTLMTYAVNSPPPDPDGKFDFPVNESRLAKARELVRQVEDYSNLHPELSLRMVDLCGVTNVSERTLQYAFKTCLGISPMNYLKRHRLHQARHELRAANPAESTVSAIACQFGFFHFGEFSQAYKTQFDESPSETLKQG